MNPAILELFHRLKSGDESVQCNAIVGLMMLLERAMKRPEANEELCGMFLTKDILAQHLSPAEVEEILGEAVEALNWGELFRSTRVSLFWAIFKVADLKYGDVLLQFFSAQADTFDEQEAFSSVAQLTDFVMRAEGNAPCIRGLLAKHRIMSVLERLQMGPSARLRESVAALIIYLQKAKVAN